MSVSAERVVAIVQGIIRERVANQPYRRFDWSDAEVGRRYFAIESGMRSWVVGPRCVVVTVAGVPDGVLWGFMAAEVLDRAAGDAGVPFDTALISQDEGSTVAVLTW